VLPVHTGSRSCNPSSRLTCPSVPAISAAWLQQLTCRTSARFRARAPGPVSGQLCRAPGGRTGHDDAGFLLPFGCRHSLLGHPVPPGASAPLAIGLQHTTAARTLAGFPCSARVRTSWDGRPLYPGDSGVHTTAARSAVAACRFTAASPCHPGAAIRPGGVRVTRHHQGFTGIRPSSLPLTCDPGTDTGALGLSPELHTPASRTRRRMSGRGQVANTDLKSHPRHHRTSTTDLLITCDLTSQPRRPIIPVAAAASRAMGDEQESAAQSLAV
jgi:hypothetical protein